MVCKSVTAHAEAHVAMSKTGETTVTQAAEPFACLPGNANTAKVSGSSACGVEN